MKANKPKLTATYLYVDGHAVQCFEKTDPDAGEVNYCEVHEQFTKARCSFTGRIIFGRWQDGMVNLIKSSATAVRCHEAKMDSGSDNTRAKGIAVGSLSIQTKGGELYWNLMPDLISGPCTYQPHNAEEFDPNVTHWATLRVARIHRVKPADVAVAA